MKTKPLELYYLIKSLRPFYLSYLRARLENVIKKGNELKVAFVIINSARKSKQQYEKVIKNYIDCYSLMAINSIISKINNSIFHVYIDDRAIFRKGRYSKLHQERIRVKKELLHYSFLYDANLLEISWKHLNMIIRVSKKFEFYDQLVLALNYKLLHKKTLTNPSLYNKTLDEIKKYENYRILYNEVIANWSFYTSNKFNDYPIDSNYDKLKTQLFITTKSFIKTNSINIYCILLFQQVEFLRLTKTYTLSNKIGERLKDVLSLKIQVKSNVRILIIDVTLYSIKLQRLEFDLDNFQKIDVSVFSPLKVLKLNYTSQELIFLKEYQKCIDLLEMLDLEFLKGQNSVEAFKFSFFLGMAHFLLGNYQEFHRVFRNMGDLEKDKEGWNAWIKIYRILAHIEERKFDLVDYEIESFRKYVERLNKKNKLKKREELIAKTLIKLKIEAYDYTKLHDNYPDLITELSAVQGDCKWVFDSPEKLLFHDWIISRASKSDYSPNFEPYRKELQKESKLQEEKLRASPDFEKMGFQF